MPRSRRLGASSSARLSRFARSAHVCHPAALLAVLTSLLRSACLGRRRRLVPPSGRSGSRKPGIRRQDISYRLARQHDADRRSDHPGNAGSGQARRRKDQRAHGPVLRRIWSSSRPTTMSAATTGMSESLPLGIEAFERDAKRLEDVKLPRTDKCKGFENDELPLLQGHQARDQAWLQGLLGRPPGRTTARLPPDRRIRRAGRLDHAVFRKRCPALEEGQGRRPARARQGSRRPRQDQDQGGRPTGRCAGLRRIALLAAPAVVEVTLPAGPGPQQGAYKEVVVSISQQYMWAYEDGTEDDRVAGSAPAPPRRPRL